MKRPVIAAEPPKRGRGRPRLQHSDTEVSVVQALDRGLTLLQILAREGAVNLTDLSLQAGMPAPTAHRLLTTLMRQQFAAYNESTQMWTVGVQAYSVGSSYLARTSLVELAKPVMRTLMEETGETANLAVTEGGYVVFLSQVESNHPIRAYHRPGSRSHLHVSGIGKALLACRSKSEVEKILQKRGLPAFTPHTLSSPSALFENLELTRQRGWSFDNEEHFEGMRCVAAAITDAQGESLAGISVSGPSTRFPENHVAEIGPKVQRAAEQISRELGA
ncbi:HTH-type transcriptional regulator BhcR [Granulosicoccus antarcticus]|uniref:HTH-type transcriptional repressor AllR n=1 Tax=Granulosicoccus antarcticus IMCC3135 TaxID=1192854 RepID=A0A2Z2NTD9_9GAMM|nr:HTH-type transcriptional regulator BhcR [Granulosicoccus antarcticus]ASJ72998.1 Acetate operon repressor [Granulosicoccus antarcticus IMCC3135]